MVIGALALPVLSASAQQKPFTVDIMMKNEEVAEALFSPRGDRLLLEKTSAYESSQNFAWEGTWSRERATLLSVSVPASSAMQTVSPGDKDRTWLASYSPSGDKAAIGWFDGDVAKAGVYDFKTGQLQKFDYRVSNRFCAFDCPLWLSEDEFIHFTLSADAQKQQMSEMVYTDEITSRWAADSWKGKTAAVKVTGSGVYQSKAIDEGGTLLRVDARSGKTTTLAEGLFWQISLSPDRHRLAAVRELGNLNVAGAEVKAIIGADKVMQLEIYDFTKGSTLIIPCKDCNVTRDSLRWSPSGNKLFFGSRVIQNRKQVHQHYIYDFRRAKLEKFVPRGVAFDTQENVRRATFVAPFVWLTDDTPAVRITKKAPSSKEKDQHDWFALPAGGAPVALTTGLKPVKDEQPLESYVAVRSGKLLMMADGELWQIDAKGQRANLTQSVSEPLSPWCSVIAYWREAGARPVCNGFRPDSVIRPIDADALNKDWLTFRVLKDDVATGEILFLNIASGETLRVAKPDEAAELVTASALARSVVYRRKGDDGDRLLLASAGSQPQELLYFNRQLAGVVGGKAVMLTRREAGETEDRYDWLLLPPNRKDGDRHPLLVYFYPDTKYSKEWRSDDLRAVSFLNQHIPAAHGFAVLLASMKISTMEERGNPMTEMHEQLVHAAENVVSQGYADPQRWAIMGHSYGGYGTNSVITQTNRFKAAVSMAGPANLTSGYAIGLNTDKATGVAAGLSFGAMWSEGGQGRMGVAPWQDPQRYIANSPLFHAQKITTPLMLVHGDYDFVNVNEAEQMFNALNRQGKDAQLVRYWGEGHVIRSPANIRDMWDRIFVWFDTNLDIARDAQGNIVMENQRVKSRKN